MAVNRQYKKTDRQWRLRRLALSPLAKAFHHRDMEIVFASSQKQYTDAFHLAHQRYLETGIINPQSDGLWMTPFHAQEDTRVALSYLDGVPVCTASIIFDSEHGLPSDEIYHSELNELRQQGRKLVEFSSLASLPVISKQNIFFFLFRFLFRYVVKCGSSDIVISIHPKHADFYSRILFFEQYGSLRYYPKFIKAKAILERLNITAATELMLTAYRDFPNSMNLFKFFFTDPISHPQPTAIPSTPSGTFKTIEPLFNRWSHFGDTECGTITDNIGQNKRKNSQRPSPPAKAAR